MSIVETVKRHATAVGQGWLPADTVKTLMAEAEVPIEQLMLELIPLASAFSLPALSSFRVGAVAQGVSGALYFGANLEFKGCSLNQTVHAEQAAVVNAANRAETGLAKLAVSAPPCGYCRQFLFELATADQLEIILADKPTAKLVDYLPGAFGPSALGVVGGLLSPQRHPLKWASSASQSESAKLTLRSAHASYAPYSQALGAVGLTIRSGETFAGPYLENAAFNPSIPPLQAALVALALAGHSIEDVSEVVVVQTQSSKIDHATAARALLERLAPKATIHEFFVRLEQAP